MSIRRDTLQTKLFALLRRLSPPRLMSVETQADEMDALARAVDRAAPKDGYDGWWPRFEDVLLEAMTTRAWPTVGEIAKAARAVSAPEAAKSKSEAHEAYGWICDWWRAHRDCPRHLAKEHHAERMVADRLATWGELRRAGFPIPDHRRAEAMAERDPNHERIRADIRAMGARIRENHGIAPGPHDGAWKRVGA